MAIPRTLIRTASRVEASDIEAPGDARVRLASSVVTSKRVDIVVHVYDASREGWIEEEVLGQSGLGENDVRGTGVAAGAGNITASGARRPTVRHRVRMGIELGQCGVTMGDPRVTVVAEVRVVMW